MDKEYIERQYKQAVLEFRAAHTDDEQWQARKDMARLERLAMELYGFKYSDNLHEEICRCIDVEELQELRNRINNDEELKKKIVSAEEYQKKFEKLPVCFL